MTTTSSTVSRVLEAMQEASKSGSSASRDVLDAHGAGTATAAAPPAPKGLSIEAEFLERPNGEKYYIRKIGIHHDVPFLQKARQVSQNILIYGPPGTGKTALIDVAFTTDPHFEGTEVFTLQGSGDTEVADLIGGYVQMPDGTYIWVDGPLVKAMESGGVLYVDEIALIDPKVLAILYGVMDGRGELLITQNPLRGVVKAKPGFYVIAACNPNAPGAVMSEALVSRFTTQFQVTTDWALAKKLGVPAKVVQCAQNMQTKVDAENMNWAPQMRELLAYKAVHDAFGEEIALRNLVAVSPASEREAVKDIVSRTFARKLPGLDLA